MVYQTVFDYDTGELSCHSLNLMTAERVEELRSGEDILVTSRNSLVYDPYLGCSRLSLKSYPTNVFLLIWKFENMLIFDVHKNIS